jgi:hypothetical protein
MASTGIRRKWQTKKDGAKRRGIAFLLSFDHYVELMRSAGITCDQIGNKKGQYGIARYNDEGDYVVGNCRFTTTTENHKEGMISKTIHGLSLGGGSHESVKGNKHYSSRGYVVTPWGTFETLRQAADHPSATCNYQNIHKKVKENISGFYYSSVDTPP